MLHGFGKGLLSGSFGCGCLKPSRGCGVAEAKAGESKPSADHIRRLANPKHENNVFKNISKRIERERERQTAPPLGQWWESRGLCKKLLRVSVYNDAA